MSAKKIFDCFIFYNEIELLRIRFDELYDLVDHFVVCEANVTFQGKAKPLVFEQYKAEFKRFADKIIHIVVDDMPGSTQMPNAVEIPKGAASGQRGITAERAFWAREHHQRNALRRGLKTAEPRDVVCISDCDEIISGDAVRQLREHDGYFLLDMPMYQFFLNMCAQASGWRKAFAYSYELDAEIGDFNVIRTQEIKSYERFAGRNHYVRQSGWHFTFLGGAAQVKDKLEAYSHAGGWQGEMRNDGALAEQMLALREVGGTKVLRLQEIDESFPSLIKRDRKRFLEAGLAKDSRTRLAELERLWSAADAQSRTFTQLYRRALRMLDECREALKQQGLIVPCAVNLISSSKRFDSGWNPGMQSIRALPTSAVPVPLDASRTDSASAPQGVLMQHVRDSVEITTDTNVGYFNLLPVVPGRAYTASCHIWLPHDFSGQRVELFLDDWPDQRRSSAALERRDRWQRIETHGVAPTGALGCNLVLRVQTKPRCSLFSSAWQLEEGDLASPYLATDG